jgi:hypothetical protein
VCANGPSATWRGTREAGSRRLAMNSERIEIGARMTSV